MGKFHIGPSDESMANRVSFQETGVALVPSETMKEETPKVLVASPAIEIRTEIVEVIREIKVPEYITVIKEVRVEVPVMMEVERIVEKIVEIPKIQIVKESVPVIHEIYDVTKVLLEKKAHDRTKRRLHLSYGILAFSLLVNLLILAVR